MEHLLDWFHEYTYLVLFLGLLLEYVFLPFPGEFVMGYSGFMAYQGDMNWFLCILLAGSGTAIGSTITYFIGYKAGMPFFEKFGRKIFLGPDKIEKTSKWLERNGGNRAFALAYFIPGVRHFTGYFAGIIRVSFRQYATYAYVGSFAWAILYVSLGRLLGSKWEKMSHVITHYLLYGIIGLVVIVVAWIVTKNLIAKKRAAKEASQQTNVDSSIQVENN